MDSEQQDRRTMVTVIDAERNLPLVQELVQQLKRGNAHLIGSGCYKATHGVYANHQKWVLKASKHDASSLHRDRLDLMWDIQRELGVYHDAPEYVQGKLLPYHAWGEVDGVFYGVQQQVDSNSRLFTAAEAECDEFMAVLRSYFGGDLDVDVRYLGKNQYSIHNVGLLGETQHHWSRPRMVVYDYGYTSGRSTVEKVDNKLHVTQTRATPPNDYKVPAPSVRPRINVVDAAHANPWIVKMPNAVPLRNPPNVLYHGTPF